MYQESENAELLELLSQVRALDDDAAVPVHHDPCSAVGPTQEVEGAMATATTPFERLDRLLIGSSPSSTHTTPAAGATAARILVDGPTGAVAPLYADGEGVSPLLRKHLLLHPSTHANPVTTGGGGGGLDGAGMPSPLSSTNLTAATTITATALASALDGCSTPQCYPPTSKPTSMVFSMSESSPLMADKAVGQSGLVSWDTLSDALHLTQPTNLDSRRSTYTLSQTLFSSLQPSGNSNDIGNSNVFVAQAALGGLAECGAGDEDEAERQAARRRAAGAATPPTVGKPVILHSPAVTSCFSEVAAAAAPALPREPGFAEPLGIRSVGQGGYYSDSMSQPSSRPQPQQRASPFVSLHRPVSATSLSSLDNNRHNTSGYARQADFTVTGSDGYGNVYASLAEAFSTAAAETPGNDSAFVAGQPPIRQQQQPFAECTGALREEPGRRLSPLLQLSSPNTLALVQQQQQLPLSSYAREGGSPFLPGGSAESVRLVTPLHQRLPSTGAIEDASGGVLLHDRFRSLTAPLGLGSTGGGGGGSGILNRTALQRPNSNNSNSVSYTAAGAKERASLDEPQPSLRPRAPNSKHTTPQTHLARTDSSAGGGGSATKVKLNYYTLPSPPRPALNAATAGSCQPPHRGSQGGVVGGDVPRILTTEADARHSMARHPHNSYGGSGVVMPSIAAQLSHSPNGSGSGQSGPPRRYDGGPASASTSPSGTAPHARRPPSASHTMHGSTPGTAAGRPPRTNSSSGSAVHPAAVRSTNSPTGANPAPLVPLLLQASLALSTDAASPLDPYVASKILSLCRDQHGCRQLQNVLTKEIFAPTTKAELDSFAENLQAFEMAYARSAAEGSGHARHSPFSVAGLSEAEKAHNYAQSVVIPVIVRAVQQNFAVIMSDAYGNFLIQKIFEIAPCKERVGILSPSCDGDATALAHVSNPNSFRDNVIAIACSPHGTFALQRLIETIHSDEEEAFIFSAVFHHNGNSTAGSARHSLGLAEDRNSLMRLLTDSNGGHVLYKMTSYLKHRYGTAGATHHDHSPNVGSEGGGGGGGTRGRTSTDMIYERMRPFYEFLLQHVFHVCTHRQGCCATQKCIDFFSEVFPLTATAGSNERGGDNDGNAIAPGEGAQAAAVADINSSNCFTVLVDRIVELTPQLAVDPFGNYVVNHLVDVCFIKGNYTLVKRMFSHIHKNIFFYGRDKFASNVVETILRHVSLEETRLVCESLMERITEATAAEERAAAAIALAFSPESAHAMAAAAAGGKGRAHPSARNPFHWADHIGKTKLEVLALDQYGNYVVQTLLTVAPVDLLLNVTYDGERGAKTMAHAGDDADDAAAGGGVPTGMLWELNKIIPEIKEKNFGKKIVTKIDLAMRRVDEQQQRC